MRLATIQKLGGLSIILGSILFLAYSILFPLLLPIDEIYNDPALFILNDNYGWITIVAFVGILLMIFGFSAVYSKLYSKSGLVGLLGFFFIELAYILQACKVTWEIFLWPVIAGNRASLFLFRDFVIMHSSQVVTLKIISSITIFIGIVLFCISLYRSKAFPKVAAVLIFIGALMYGLGPMAGIVPAICGVFILSIGCSIVGFKLIKK
jgi:hypothetical protein